MKFFTNEKPGPAPKAQRTDERLTSHPRTLAYCVPGKPVSWARKRLDTRRKGRSLTFTSDAQLSAMRAHQLAALAAFGGKRSSWPLTGAFEVYVTGYYASAVVGDCDRLGSLALDALEGLTYETDRQVRVMRSAIVADGSPERVEVLVRRMAEDPVKTAKQTRKSKGRPSLPLLPHPANAKRGKR